MNKRITELEAQLETVTDPQRRIDILNELAWELRDSNPQRALTLCEKSYTLARQKPFKASPYQKGLAYSLSYQGYINHYKANYGLALSQSLEAVTLFEQIDHLKGLPAPLNIIGITYLRSGNYSEALPYHLRALEIAEEIGDRAGQARALNGIAIVFVWSGDHQQALTYFNKSLEVYEQIGDKSGEVIALMNLCMSYRDLGQHEASLERGFKCLLVCEEIEHQGHRAAALDNIANTYVAIGLQAEALIYFHQALELIKDIEDKYIQVSVLLHTGKTYHQTGQSEKAQSYLNQALAVAEESGQKGFQFECHQALAEVYKEWGNFEQALIHYEQFHLLKQAVFNEEADNRLKTLEVLHRTEITRKEAEIYQLKNVALEQEIVERERAEQALKAYSEQLEEMVEDRTRQLQDAQERLIRQEKLAFLGQLASSVGHELRNPLGVISNAVYFLQMVLAGTNETVNEYLDLISNRIQEAEKIVSDLLNLSRNRTAEPQETIVSALVAEALDRHPLPPAVDLTLKIDPDLPPVYVDSQQICQVLVNLISNACQAMADQGELTISAQTEQNQISLSIEDTGHGMPAEVMEKIFEPLYTTRSTGIGLGLAISKNLAHLNGVTIQVDSIQGQGTTFSLNLPTYQGEGPARN